MKYRDLKPNEPVAPGDEFKPHWETAFRRLPPPYGWKRSVANGAEIRRPLGDKKITNLQKQLL